MSNEVDRYNASRRQSQEFQWLDLKQLEQALLNGEVAFGPVDVVAPQVMKSAAMKAAREAFEDGLVMMFIDGEAVRNLDETLDLKLGSQVLYIKLSPQRGI
ncbi:hypothetical protein [Oceaniferula spumae]|uniref:hypothetical protein n=1 Tax=Oceaniferula spumae TaxID=2979115 RepID=UPI003F4E9ACD